MDGSSLGKRIDSSDTIDEATHYLHRLQSAGWGLQSIEHEIEYGSASPKSPKLPIRATVTIRLIPAR